MVTVLPIETIRPDYIDLKGLKLAREVVNSYPRFR